MCFTSTISVLAFRCRIGFNCVILIKVAPSNSSESVLFYEPVPAMIFSFSLNFEMTVRFVHTSKNTM